MMKCSRISLLCLLTFVIVNQSGDAIFFHYPKRAIMSFLESLGGHKKLHPPVHHYHMHYYPVPVILPKPAPPPKIEIDLSAIHHHRDHDQLRSLSWASQEYSKLHDPEIVIPSSHSDDTSSAWASSLPEAWPDSLHQKSWEEWNNDNDILEKDRTYKEAKPSGILLQVPLQQQIVFYQPPSKDTKSSLLTILLKKLRRLNDALFHPEHEESTEHHDNKAHITNSLNYATTT